MTVDCNGYILNADAWVADGASAQATLGTSPDSHAERVVLRSLNSLSLCHLLVQNAFPCTACHNFFVGLSNPAPSQSTAAANNAAAKVAASSSVAVASSSASAASSSSSSAAKDVHAKQFAKLSKIAVKGTFAKMPGSSAARKNVSSKAALFEQVKAFNLASASGAGMTIIIKVTQNIGSYALEHGLGANPILPYIIYYHGGQAYFVNMTNRGSASIQLPEYCDNVPDFSHL